MQTLSELLAHFFTHKDFLPEPSEIAGTLFTPLHLWVAAVLAVIVAVAAWQISKREERVQRGWFIAMWLYCTVVEIIKIIWESCAGETVRFDWWCLMPLYPCSIFMYAMPFAIWGRGKMRNAACGYVCSLGLLGGAINFIYPASVLGDYSCISFAGAHTLLYHGAMVFTAVIMLLSGYHKLTGVTGWKQLLLPAVPCLIVSIPANIVNFTIGADYMFFRLDSFFFAPLGAATPDVLGVIIVYGIYLLIHALPYLPSYIVNKKKHLV